MAKSVSTHPVVKFNNGLCCPILGLGTYRAKEDEGMEAVKTALDVGYRHIDTAYYYLNEKQVGAAIRGKIAEGVICREDVFVTSKLWNSFHRKDLVEPALDKTLENLGLDYIDLYLIHWPFAYKEGWDLNPKSADGSHEFSETSFIETWIALEEMVKCGKTKSIGLSNFNKNQILQILDVASIKPVTNQVECHPYLSQVQLQEFCESKGITITAYRPLGGQDNANNPIEDPVVVEMAHRYNKTPAQIMLKFLTQRGIIAIPKSITTERIKSNFDIFDFDLSNEDVCKLFELDRGSKARSISMVHATNHKDYPFHDEF